MQEDDDMIIVNSMIDDITAAVVNTFKKLRFGIEYFLRIVLKETQSLPKLITQDKIKSTRQFGYES